jgi:hypothetical protein
MNIFLSNNLDKNMMDDYVTNELCTICYKANYEWKPYGTFHYYCTSCWLEYLNKTTEKCKDCKEKFLLGDLCCDGYIRYTYRCKPCQIEYYFEDAITMFEEISNFQ